MGNFKTSSPRGETDIHNLSWRPCVYPRVACDCRRLGRADELIALAWLINEALWRVRMRGRVDVVADAPCEPHTAAEGQRVVLVLFTHGTREGGESEHAGSGGAENVCTRGADTCESRCVVTNR